ncbi:MAG: hypothetical protein ABIN74_08750 [Ferruginibacter sp.]
MKMIKSFLIVVMALGVSTALHAQEQKVKAEIAKPVASTVPPPGAKLVLAPEVKPESINGTFQKSEEAITTVAPFPSTGKAERIKAPEIKSTAIMTDEKLVITQPVLVPNDQNAKPLPATSVPKAKNNQ